MNLLLSNSRFKRSSILPCNSSKESIGRGGFSFDSSGASIVILLVSMYALASAAFVDLGFAFETDDVDAVTRLPLLNNTFYKDLLCEIGGMFAIANRVDSIHKIPWIGFQTWRAGGRKVLVSHMTCFLSKVVS